jgi:hypothetical protein
MVFLPLNFAQDPLIHQFVAGHTLSYHRPLKTKRAALICVALTRAALYTSPNLPNLDDAIISLRDRTICHKTLKQ